MSQTAPRARRPSGHTLGDVKSSSQITGGNPYPFGYTYNLANAMKTMTQPSSRTFTWTYDTANRATKLAGAPSGGGTTNYASSIAYASQGPISQFTLGNGLVENRSYDPYRQQPTGVTLGTAANPTSFLNLGFAYCTGAPPPASCTTNNGNLQSQTIATPNVTQTYGYDAYNRLNSAAEKAGSSTVWSETFNYDIYGNRWVPSSSGISLSALTVTSDAYNTLTNRLTSGNFGYDTAGNETTISFTVTYDVENRQTGFSSISNGTATYTYNGDGRRVTKTTSGVTTTYVYDAKGDLASEYSTQPPPPPCLTCYITTDHLGSTRVVTDETAAVTARHDFLPFGEELTTSNRTAALGYGAYDNVMHKYTGQERDTEGPGLDFFHARYFHDAQGRFTGPDPVPWLGWQKSDAGHRQLFSDFIRNPQNLNRYAHVLNSPLSATDPSGLYTCSGTADQCAEVEDKLAGARGSSNEDVSRAAEAYGAAGDDNGVHVSFTDSFASSTTRATTGIERDAFGNIVGISVKLKGSEFFGDGGLGAGVDLLHEGSHVADFQDHWLGTLMTGVPDTANITNFQSEVRAYMTGTEYAQEHGGMQGSRWPPDLPLSSAPVIGVFLNNTPSGSPPYRAYSSEALRLPIDLSK